MGSKHSLRHRKKEPPVSLQRRSSVVENQPTPESPVYNQSPQSPQPVVYSQEPQPSPPVDIELTMAMFKEFAEKFGIGDKFASKLRKLGDFNIVMLNDDSGSMNSDAYTSEFLSDPYAKINSRFEELRAMVECVIDKAGVLSKEAIDVEFLNREGKRGVRLFQEVKDCFDRKPTKHDLTPMVKSLKRIIANKKTVMAENNLLIFIATDGAPTDDQGHANIPEMDKYLEHLMAEYPNLYITFMACVSDEKLLKTMDKWGQKYDRIGVVDEYYVEYKEMMDKHKDEPEFQFTHGDYITKALLVSIDPEVKQLFRDESSSSDEEES